MIKVHYETRTKPDSGEKRNGGKGAPTPPPNRPQPRP